MEQISVSKAELRADYTRIRDSIGADERARHDSAILNKLLNTDVFCRAELVLTYVSYGSEVDTYALIEEALSRGKQVAAARCEDGNGSMSFRLISGTECLHKGMFGLSEPGKELPEPQDYADSVCIVPALSFDEDGFRLGYGKGYYDRFLADYPGSTVGLCYSECLSRFGLPRDKFDISVGTIVTDCRIYSERITADG